jgi:hypothetical protein
MISAHIDEKTGDVYTADGNYLCSLGEVINAKENDRPDYSDYEEEDEEDEDERYFRVKPGLSETLIKRQTEFKLPKNKKHIENELWVMFSGGIHQAMSNISTQKQYQETLDHMRAAILTSMTNTDVSNEMAVHDLIQLDIWARNLVARSATFEGDHLRDATLIGRQLNPGAIDALRYTPEKEKAGGGFFSFLKR